MVQEWKITDEGDSEQLSEIAIYVSDYFLSLKKDKIYLIDAEWKEGRSDRFFGEAEYVLVTE